MFDVIIVGGGPAGLAAGVYAARKRLKTLLVSENIGGQVNRTLGIENYLGYQFIEGAELISRFESQVAQYPLERLIGPKVSRIKRSINGFEVILDSGKIYEARVLVYTAGKRLRELSVPGEIEFTGRGVSYCAVCDGPLFADRRVAVVGGGNSGLEAALDMVKIAEHVDVVSLTPFSGDAVLIEKLLRHNNLNVYLEHEADRVLGTDFVEGLEIRSVKTHDRITLPVSGVFVEIGLIPNSEPLKDIMEFNERGEVPINCRGETSVPGLFAAGDVSDVPEKQIIIAAGEGAKAMLQAHRYLRLRNYPD
jgi:NADH-dependent peroxiredoxin subunit F